MRRRRTLAAAGVSAAAGAALLVGCAASGEERIEAVLPLDGESAEVMLTDVFDDGTWDAFAVVCPYTPRVRTAERLGVDPSSVPEFLVQDGAQALLLLADGEVVRQLPGDRARVDFCFDGTPGVASADTPLELAYDRRDGHWHAVVPVPRVR